MSKELVELARGAADKHGINQDLVCAVVFVESAWNPWAVRHEPLFKYLYHPRECADRFGIPSVTTETFLQMTSLGLMQVMGAVAREYGFDRWLTELSDPELGLEYGCRHLKKKLEAYGGDEMAAVSAYNAGVARKTHGGMFTNQAHVDRVHARLVELRRIG
jgi:soluble lytic murein transglycosylase-like protein